MAGATIDVLHVIDGEEVPSASARTFTSINPATGEPVAEVAYGEAGDVDRAVTAAARAFDDGTWRHLAPAERARRLRRVAELIRAEAPSLARLETADSGKLLSSTTGEIEAAAQMLEYAAGLPEQVKGTVFADTPDCFVHTRREPYGVVGAI